MKETIRPFQPEKEYYISEGCHIIEMLQAEDDKHLSIARARVLPGVTTRRHHLLGTTERYVILEGRGLVEVGDLPPQKVAAGDVVLIPPGCHQRISNTGSDNLLFLAICTPPFRAENYQETNVTSTEENGCQKHG